MTLRAALALICAVFTAPTAAANSASADMTREVLESGRLADGEAKLVVRLAADPGDREARFGLAMVQFSRGIENFGRRQYVYGALSTQAIGQVPFLRLPVPQNPKPEPISYEAQRANLQGLFDDLAKVEATLAPLAPGETRIVVDLNTVKFDFVGDGTPRGVKTLGAVIGELGLGGETKLQPFEVKFDLADVYWLRGYARLLSAFLDMALAYDWRESFEQTAALFYPEPRPPAFPLGLAVPPGTRLGFFGDDATWADVIVFVHDIRWKLKEPERMPRALLELKQTIALSRLTWATIVKETGDDREWIPGPQQKHGVFPSMSVTQERIDGWLTALDRIEAALDGKMLVPHWRLKQGINLRRVFAEPRDFDLVLWAAGQAAVPYLEAGPTFSIEEFNRATRSFGDEFLLYAAWFN